MKTSHLPAEVHELITWLSQFKDTTLTTDSRNLVAGQIFLAYPGIQNDGRAFIVAAMQKGAAAVVYEKKDFKWDFENTYPHFAVTDLAKWAGYIANGYYQKPDKDMYVTALTGTNGKTSCTHWIAHALSNQTHDRCSAVVGTLGIGIYQERRYRNYVDSSLTTPQAVGLQTALRDLQNQKVDSLAIEASSIGLVQHRLSGLHIDTAVLTNLTRDHLDYHGSMENYEAAKSQLFDWFSLKNAVINVDDPAGQRLLTRLQGEQKPLKLFAYSIDENNEYVHKKIDVDVVQCLRAKNIRFEENGTVFEVIFNQQFCVVKTQLIGQFNVSNCLAVLACLLCYGLPWEWAIHELEQLKSLPGRMQQVGGKSQVLVVIDYAHTPDALLQTLLTLRSVANDRGGKLWCVFGCGGDRDSGKRPQMGRVAEQADHIIITSDNPRFENALDIMEQIKNGLSEKQATMIEDRSEAIFHAVQHADPADVILLAGKGHETYQEIRGNKYPFSDFDQALLALSNFI